MTRQLKRKLLPRSGSRSRSSRIQQLLAMPLAERIETIAADVRGHEDRFCRIEAHELAEALGISDAWRPGSEWAFTQYARKISVEEYAEINDAASEFVYLIEDSVSAPRFRALLEHSSRLKDCSSDVDFSFLTSRERKLLEERIAQRLLNSARDDGLNCVARRSVKTRSRFLLRFEAIIEDDGACIQLKTPYDFRDGKFFNFDNCLTDSW